MARFVCDSYPSLVIWGPGRVLARFVGGVCDTVDERAVAALRRRPYIVEVGAPAAPTPPPAAQDPPEPGPAAGGASGVDPPPQAGRGSSKDAWLAYAHTQGVHVPDDATRDDIITAARDAGVRVD